MSSETALATAASLPNAVWVPVTARRVLDTRGSLGGVGHAVPPRSAIAFSVTGRAGVPSAGVSAVAVSLTAVAPTASGRLVAYPSGATRPNVASVTFTATQATTSLVVVRPGSAGHVAVFNSAGTTHVTADVVGYFATAGTTTTGSTLVPLTPRRVLDTRGALGGVGHAVAPGGAIAFRVTGAGGVPASGVSSVVVALTAVSPTASGRLVAYPSGAPRPNVASVTFTARQATTSLVVARPGSAGRVALFNSAGTTHVTADVVGYFAAPGTTTAGSTLVPLPPRRILDTRSSLGGVGHAVAPGGAVNVTATGVAGVPSAGVSAVVVALTAMAPTASGRLVAYPYGTARPNVATVTFTARRGATSLVVVRPGSGGRVAVFNSAGTTHVAADVVGYYSTLTVPPPPSAMTATAQDKGADVTWTPPPAPSALPILGYRVTAAPGGATAVVGTVTSFAAANLTNGTSYRFTVAARNALGFGPPGALSPPVVPQAPPLPGPVPAVTATAGHREATVKWDTPADEGVTGYTVTTTPPTPPLTVTGDARTATIPGLENGAAYTIHVAATNASGTGPATSSNAVVPSVTAPGPPESVTAAPTGSGIVVTWTPPSNDGGSAITGYAVTSTPGGATATTGPSETSVTMGGLEAGTTYTFAVVAQNAEGAGAVAASEPANPSVDVASSTVVLDGDSLAALSAVRTNGELLFSNAPPQVTGLSPGAVLVAGPSDRTPDGLLAAVVSVATDEAVTLVATRPASLDEALAGASFGVSGALPATGASFVAAVDGVRLRAAPSEVSTTMSFDIEAELYKDALGRKITASGHVSVTPRVTFAASIRCCFHTSSRFTASVTAKAKLSLVADMTHDLSGGVTLGTVKLRHFYVQVGPVPLVLQPTLTLRLISDGTVTAGVRTSVSATAALGVEITTDDGDVEAKPIRTWVPGYTPPTLFGNVHARAGVGARLDLNVNGHGGPFVTNDLWVLALHADVTESPWWRLSVENDVGAGYELKVLGRTLATWRASTLAHFAYEYARAPGAFARLVISPGNAAVTPGGTVHLTASLAGQPPENITWSANGGSISPDGVFTAPAAAGTYSVLASSPARGLLPASTGLMSVRVGPQPPAPPTHVAAAAHGVGSAVVRWTPPTDTGGGSITGYTVVASPGGAEHHAPASATDAKFQSLMGGQTYTFTVVAETTAGRSVPSAPSEPILVQDSEQLDSYVSLSQLGAGRAPNINADGRYVTWAGTEAVFRVDTDTGDVVDLTALFKRTPRHVDEGPTMDSTGSIVAWWENDCYTATLVLGDVRTGEARPVGNLILPCYGSVPKLPDAPDLSADGRYLAFYGVPAGVEIIFDEAWNYCENCWGYIYDALEGTYEPLPPEFGRPRWGPWHLSGNGRYVVLQHHYYDRVTKELTKVDACGGPLQVVQAVSFDGNVLGGYCGEDNLAYDSFMIDVTSDDRTYFAAELMHLAMDGAARTHVVAEWHCPWDCVQSATVYDGAGGHHGLGLIRSVALSGDGKTVALARGDGIWLGRL